MASDQWADPPRFAELEADYELLGELGRGSSAVVYYGRERELGREVAIKVARADGDDEARERLRREAKLLGSLQHPHIVSLYGARRLSGGGLALILQYVRGRTLGETLELAGSLPFEEVARILAEIGRALAYAHAQGVVHGNLGPARVRLEDATGAARLAGFGRADTVAGLRLSGGLGRHAAALTYASPEQLDGGDADARSDIYSLGRIGYALLAGVPPYVVEDVPADGAPDPRAGMLALGRLRPGIPAPLWLALERALELDPAERWADAAELVAALEGRLGPRQTGPARPAAAIGGNAGGPPTHAPYAEPGAPYKQEAVAAALALAEASPDGHYDGHYGGHHGHHGVAWTVDAPPGDARARWRAPTVALVLLLIMTGSLLAFALRPWSGDANAAAEVTSLPSRSSSAALPVGPAGGGAGVNGAGGSATGATDENGGAGAAGGQAEGGEAALVYALFGDRQEGVAGDTLPEQLVLRVEDAAGRPVAGATVRFTVRAGEASIVPETLATDEFGLAGARWVPHSTGVHEVEAAADAVAGRISFRARARPREAEAAAETVASPTAAPTAEEPRAPPALAVRAGFALGGLHSCSLNGSGSAICWGGNDSGQLGDGAAGRRGGAVAVAAPEPLAEIAAGVSHSCAVGVSGSVYCWGANTHGQLGDGSATNRAAPVRVAADRRMTRVVAGLSHSCALDAAGALFCWGDNAHGQLGDGSRTARAAPVPAGRTLRFRAVAVGWAHTCALAGDGIAYCWGRNASGELGDGSTADRAQPVLVSGGHRFTAIAAGSHHTCGLRRDGVVLCWGQSTNGQLGTGSIAPTLAPATVAGDARYSALALGGVHSCALTRDGAAHCWGRNTYGQLGDGTTQDRLEPMPAVGGHRFRAIEASGAHTCGTTVEGRSFCWGYNAEGQLGTGSRANQSRPSPLSARG